MSRLKVGIIGVGMVGGPLKRYFEEIAGYSAGRDLFLYDIDRQKGYFDDVNRADVIFICVPTPSLPDGAADLAAVGSALKKLNNGKTAVIKSTVPPGTTEFFQKSFPRLKILFNPEFLREATAFENMVKPDRQFVGYTAKSRAEAPKVLAILPKAPVSAPSRELKMTATEAEIVKYAANDFLTRKVVFANAIHNIAARHGAEYENIRIGIASDKRIGDSHLDVNHGGYRGYGGYCFVKDLDALIAHCRDLGETSGAEIFEADRNFNRQLLAEQGLTMEDVSLHNHEWLKKKRRRKPLRYLHSQTARFPIAKSQKEVIEVRLQ